MNVNSEDPPKILQAAARTGHICYVPDVLPADSQRAGLFSAAPETTSRRCGRPALSVAIQIAAVAIAAIVLLYREDGLPAWATVYGEDGGVFLPQALAHPGHLLTPYQGYLQLLPRLIAEGVALLPLTWAAAAFAITGAAIAGLCALFTYHASAGYIASPALRAVLGAALILLPVAPMELIDNGVNTPWYVLVALFWATLWRPRTRAGMAAAAIIAFLGSASTPVAIVFLPLLAVRVWSLRRVREHAVTIGWLAGWPLQGYAIARSYADHVPRVGKLAPLSKTTVFYLRAVVLRAFGWHFSWFLTRTFGLTGATICCAIALAAIAGWVMTTGRTPRNFAILAVTGGFAYAVFTSTITSYIPYEGAVIDPINFEPGSRYTVLPIMLLVAMAIVGVDATVQRRGGLRVALRSGSLSAAVAAVLLVGVLGAGWVTDYRYPTQRTPAGPWAPSAARLVDRCHPRSPAQARPDTVRLFLWGAARAGRWAVVSCSRLYS
jgi:hypothetical protein